MGYKLITLLSYCFLGQHVFAQADTVFNKVDVQGKRIGVWKTYMQPLEGEKYFYEIATYNHDRYDGLVIHFSPKGVKIEETYYRNDTLNGPSKLYYSNGELREEKYFKDGRIHGMWRFYSYDGKLQEEQEYVEGVQTGIYRRFSISSGRLVEESYMVNGLEQGTRKIFEDIDERTISREFDFKNGVRIAARYYNEGKLSREETFNYEKELKKVEKLRKSKDD